MNEDYVSEIRSSLSGYGKRLSVIESSLSSIKEWLKKQDEKQDRHRIADNYKTWGLASLGFGLGMATASPYFAKYFPTNRWVMLAFLIIGVLLIRYSKKKRRVARSANTEPASTKTIDNS